jgi:acyl-CoA-binding protein
MSENHKAIAVVDRPAAPAAAPAPAHDTRAMSPVVALGMEILRNNPSPEALERLLQMQRDHEANEARKAYAVALIALKRDLPTVIARDKAVEFKSTFYKHASLAQVMDAVTEALTAHGFALTWHPSSTGNTVTVKCRLTHHQGHFEEVPLSAPVDTQGGKSAIQGVGSTMTMLQRYSALALLGISTADMPEEQAEARKPEVSNVDTNRNMKWVAWLKKQGKSKEAAEAFLDKPFEEWTAGDCERLKAWAMPEPGSNG